MIALVTGGAGFIGSHIVDALIDRKIEVKVLDSLEKPVHTEGTPSYLNPEAEFIPGDVRDSRKLTHALKGVDIVFHMAAYQDYLTDFSKFFSVNSVGTALLYETIVKKGLPIKKIVMASSQAVYGEGSYLCDRDGSVYPDIRPLAQLKRGDWEVKCPVCGGHVEAQHTDESRVNPKNQYAMSKHTQELIGINLGRRYDIPTVAMRYSIVQGPRQSFYNAYSGVCRIFCVSMLSNKRPTIYEDGRQIRDYVNIHDVVRANLLVMDREEANFQVYNVGGGKPYTVIDFYNIVGEVIGKKGEPLLSGEYRFGDTRHIISDISKLKLLGWEPKHSPRESVKEYVEWIKDKGDLKAILERSRKRMRREGVIRRVAE